RRHDPRRIRGDRGTAHLQGRSRPRALRQQGRQPEGRGGARVQPAADAEEKAVIDHVDHIVLTTRDLPGCLRFYCEVLGMKMEKFQTPGATRIALKFGKQKINVHEWGKEYSPRAHVAAPGTLDLCFISSVSLDEVIQKLKQNKVEILEG